MMMMAGSRRNEMRKLGQEVEMKMHMNSIQEKRLCIIKVKYIRYDQDPWLDVIIFPPAE